MLRISLLVVLLFPWRCSSLLGWVESPGYPRGYWDHASFSWSLCASEGHVLSIHLLHLDLEDSQDCDNDALKVFSNGDLVKVLCGKIPFEELQSSVNPQLQSSPGGCLNLSFHSDFNHQRHAGFRGFYATQAVNCGRPNIPKDDVLVLVESQKTNTMYKSQVQFNCSSPYYTLEGDDTYTCGPDGEWVSSDNDTELPKCTPVCGKPTVELSSPIRIIGGSDAPQGSIPWQVRFSPHAGGMIIADRWVLTAASILQPHMQTVEMFWGTNTRTEVSNAISASIHRHPGYNYPDRSNHDNDIALVKLPEPVTFNQLVMPICLPTNETALDDGTIGVVSGFGFARSDDGGYIYSNNLNYVQLPVVNPEKCSESLNVLRKINREVPHQTPNMFCAGYPGGEKDSCHGDSGGPFVIKRNDQYWAAGIVSWGTGCAREGRYGFYTRVSNYVDWIHKTMEEN